MALQLSLYTVFTWWLFNSVCTQFSPDDSSTQFVHNFHLMALQLSLYTIFTPQFFWLQQVTCKRWAGSVQPVCEGEFKTVHFQCWSDWWWFFSVVLCSFHLIFFSWSQRVAWETRKKCTAIVWKESLKPLALSVDLTDDDSSVYLDAVFISLFLRVAASHVWRMSRKCTASRWRCI